MECYLTVTCDSFPFMDIKKNHPNSKRGFTYKRLTYEEFFNLYNLLGENIVYPISITNSFPKTDRDLKTGF